MESPRIHSSVGSDPVPFSQNGRPKSHSTSEHAHSGKCSEKLYTFGALRVVFVSWKIFSESTVSLQVVFGKYSPEKKSTPGASRSTTDPTMMAISTYTTVVRPIARNVPLGIAFWGSYIV